VLRPLEKPGYQDFSLLQNGRAVTSINRDEAASIRANAPEVPVIENSDEVRTSIPGRAGIKTAQYEGNAQWVLKWAGKAVHANICDKDWLEAFQKGRAPAPPGSWIDVTMEMITSRENPDAAPTYRVLKVHGCQVPPQVEQTTFLPS